MVLIWSLAGEIACYPERNWEEEVGAGGGWQGMPIMGTREEGEVKNAW